MQVKVLSVKNPFAYSIIYGGKDVENRTWNTDYRGRLYIHVSGEPEPFPIGSSKLSNASKEELYTKYKKYADAFGEYRDSLIDKYIDLGVPVDDDTDENWWMKVVERTFDNKHLWQLQPQRIIGYVDIVDVVKDSQSLWAEDNQYHWILKNPTPLKEPICSVKGRLGLWNYNLPE